MKYKPWTQADLLEALDVFRMIKAKGENFSHSNPALIQLAKKLGRSIASVVMRMHNFLYYETNGQYGLKTVAPT